jgi:hypothetical protein
MTIKDMTRYIYVTFVENGLMESFNASGFLWGWRENVDFFKSWQLIDGQKL